MAARRIFLERRSYRMRRVMDAVRLWPLMGLALWMVPLMWPRAGAAGAEVPMSSVLIYLFGVWAMLIAGAAALWWRTTRAGAAGEDMGAQTNQTTPEPR